MQTTFKIFFSCLFCLALTLLVAAEQADTEKSLTVERLLTIAEQAEIDKIIAKHGIGAILRYLATQSDGKTCVFSVEFHPPSVAPYTVAEPMAMPIGVLMPLPDPVNMPPVVVPTSQIDFLGVESLVINWDAKVPGTFDSAPLLCPATHEFGQGGIYRLKLSNIPGHPGKELFPTLEIAPATAQTQAFLAHCSIPVMFSDDDFVSVFDGHLITKIIYLPNRDHPCNNSLSSVNTLVSAERLGHDLIAEANERGAILAIIRLGNKQFLSSGGQCGFLP
jgi:hypothetical protein